jgi:hypothetical protein
MRYEVCTQFVNIHICRSVEWWFFMWSFLSASSAATSKIMQLLMTVYLNKWGINGVYTQTCTQHTHMCKSPQTHQTEKKTCIWTHRLTCTFIQMCMHKHTGAQGNIKMGANKCMSHQADAKTCANTNAWSTNVQQSTYKLAALHSQRSTRAHLSTNMEVHASTTRQWGHTFKCTLLHPQICSHTCSRARAHNTHTHTHIFTNVPMFPSAEACTHVHNQASICI